MSPLTDPQLADELVDAVRTFVVKEVLPVASEFEHADEYPHDLVEAMKGLGLMGCMIPEEYGGFGLDAVTYSRIIEELSAGWMSLSGVLNTHTMVATLLKLHGTDKQKGNWLPRMATGEIRGALSLSEPDAGSDTNALRCKATPDGGEYIINGTKMWVTNGVRAGIVALAARAPEGITCFMIEKEPGDTFGGISVSRTIGKLGYKGIETVEMSYNDHRIPAEWVLGGPEEGLGKGRRQILGGLELGRVNIASRAVGVARAAFEAAISYAQQRETFGVPIAKHQAIQFKLADMATKLEAARLLTRSAAAKFDAGERADLEAGMAKLFASEAALDIATESMRIHGGYGYTTEFPVERYFRDAPLMIIGEGTNEIQRMVIARALLAKYEQ
jgi:butyryl-CoA dehydrogenase